MAFELLSEQCRTWGLAVPTRCLADCPAQPGGVLRMAGQSVRRWSGHAAGIQALALSPDGNMIITGSDDHTARIFSAA